MQNMQNMRKSLHFLLIESVCCQTQWILFQNSIEGIATICRIIGLQRRLVVVAWKFVSWQPKQNQIQIKCSMHQYDQYAEYAQYDQYTEYDQYDQYAEYAQYEHPQFDQWKVPETKSLRL